MVDPTPHVLFLLSERGFGEVDSSGGRNEWYGFCCQLISAYDIKRNLEIVFTVHSASTIGFAQLIF